MIDPLALTYRVITEIKILKIPKTLFVRLIICSEQHLVLSALGADGFVCREQLEAKHMSQVICYQLPLLQNE